jgi:hypothetical protein
MRYCVRCNRPLDAEHHDVEKDVVTTIPQGGGYAHRRKRRYKCRVVLVANSVTDGKLIPATMPQRLKAAGNARYVHQARAKLFQEAT